MIQHEVFRRLREEILAGRPAAMATVVTDTLNTTIGSKLLFLQGMDEIGDLPEDLKADVRPILDDILRSSTVWGQRRQGGQPVGTQYREWEIRTEGRVRTVGVFFEAFLPSPNLIVLGGGHVAVPIVKIGALLNYRVFVVDDRVTFATPSRFPDAHQVILKDFERAFEGLPVSPSTAVVIVTRGHRHDAACLRQALTTGAGYIGMIGSQRRVRALMAQLEEEGYPPEQLTKVHAPIGLDIGAETPEEIALSILAEITKSRRGGTGLSLSDRRREGLNP